MTAPNDADRMVHAFLQDGPAELSPSLNARIRDEVRDTKQRAVRRSGRTPSMPRSILFLAPLAAILIAVGAMLGVGIGGPPPVQGPSPEASAHAISSPAPTATASAGATVEPTPAPAYTREPPLIDRSVLVMETIGANEPLPADRLLTSDRFGTAVTFWVQGHDDRAGGRVSNWCAPRTSPWEIALRSTFACGSGLSILRPSAIDCGAGPTPTTSDELTARLLARPALGARDRGALTGSPLLPDDLFTVPLHGRIIDVNGEAPVSSKLDPDGCVIRAGDTDIVVRRDQAMRLVAIDTAAGLAVIVNVDNARHIGRHVGPPPDGGLGQIHELTFGPARN